MEVPEVPILVGNLVVPIVALLGALLLAWAMLADVLDLCRIVGEFSYDLGTLYEVVQSLPGAVTIYYSGPTECRLTNYGLNCSFFMITSADISHKIIGRDVYTSELFLKLSKYFIVNAKVVVSEKYADEAGFVQRIFHVYRGFAEPIPLYTRIPFQFTPRWISISKKDLDDPLVQIYNKAVDVVETADALGQDNVQEDVAIILAPNQFLFDVEGSNICLAERIYILPGDINMINETTQTIYIKYWDVYEEIDQVDLSNFNYSVVNVDLEGNTDLYIYWNDGSSSFFNDVEEIWYDKTIRCLDFSDIKAGSITIDSVHFVCTIAPQMNYTSHVLTIRYISLDGNDVLSIGCNQ